MANFWMKRRLGRKVDAEFKKTLPANATLPPYVRSQADNCQSQKRKNARY